MRTLAFFRIYTDVLAPRFGIQLREKGDLYLPYYRHGAFTSPDPRDPGLPGLQMLLARAPEAASLPKDLFVARVSASSRRKPIDPRRVPDFWTLEGIALASERFLDVMGEDGRSAADVSRIALYDYASGQLISSNHFTFVCRHVAKVSPVIDAVWEDVCDSRIITSDQIEELGAIVENKDLLNYMNSLPIWVLYDKPYAFYVSPERGRRLIGSDLVGFKEFKPTVFNGDLSHVWTSFIAM